jgi:hypothetical protein
MANSYLSPKKEAAFKLLALALNHPASEQTTKARTASLLARIEPELFSSAIEAAWERAKAKGVEALVAEVLILASLSQPSGYPPSSSAPG